MDVNGFFTILLFMLSSVLLVVLIVLGIKLINTIGKLDKVLDDVDLKLRSLDKMFGVVDVVTDSMALVSDKIVDVIMFAIKKVFNKKKGKEDEVDEQE